METSVLPETTGQVTGNRERGGGDEEIRVKGEEGERNLAGNRWPRQETLALLKIRSDLDASFRDSCIKTPLWGEVSRKLSELGYNRSAKKCKEKFENIYKYHRRTKEGRSGKTYRYFDQLQALDNSHSLLPLPPTEVINYSMAMDIDPISEFKNDIQNQISSFLDASTSTTSSSSKGSAGTHKKKKRKLTEFFERLMKEVIKKQENLQSKFVEAIEKYEQERIAREEAWKIQEMARIKREHELLVEERSIAAAKDAAMLALLQKFSEQASPVQFTATPISVHKVVERQDSFTGSESFTEMSSSRWPKDEVEALIRLRSNLDSHYQDSGPKGPLWEDISAAMKKLGYYRSAKRCKEKWENMNKYFRKVKESNKRRPEDANTCPYFHQLEALYKKKTSKKVDNSTGNPVYELKPEELLMHMMGAQEEQQRLGSLPINCRNGSANQDYGDGDDEDNEVDNEDDDYQLLATNDPAPEAIMS